MPRKNILTAFILLAVFGLGLFAFSTEAQADGSIYYLNPASGNDNNDGSIQFPWKTLDKMAISVAPGDTVHIRGGTYTEGQYTTTADGIFQWRTYTPFDVGTPDNPITISAYPGEKVIFDGGKKPYFIFFNSIYDHNYSGHFIILKNLEFINYAGSAIRGGYSDQDGIWPTRNVVVDNCSFKNFSDLDTGAVVFGYSTDIIIKNSRFENMGVSAHTMHPIYISEGSSNILIENNSIIGGSGFGIHTYGHAKYSLYSKNHIYRKNKIINVRSTQIIVSATNYDNIHIYQNTLFTTHNPYPLRDNNDASTHLMFSPYKSKNIVVKNNIGYGPISEANIRFWRSSDATTGTLESLLPNYYFKNNIWYNSNNESKVISDYAPEDGTLDYYSLEEFQQLSGYSNDSSVDNLSFNNPDNFDLTLQGNSPAIDAGDFLTHTTSAGSGTSIAVQDAGYFADGYDVVEGDVIKIGSEAVAITEIDYQNNILTIDRNISWQNNDNVSLPYAGSRPDIGAYEYGNPADINSDTHINIKDIQICIKAITSPSSISAEHLQRCKELAPPDSVANIKDIQVIIRAILNPN